MIDHRRGADIEWALEVSATIFMSDRIKSGHSKVHLSFWLNNIFKTGTVAMNSKI